MFLIAIPFFLFHSNVSVYVGIEAADLTSLLEQFEETQGNHLWQIFLLRPV